MPCQRVGNDEEYLAKLDALEEEWREVTKRIESGQARETDEYNESALWNRIIELKDATETCTKIGCRGEHFTMDGYCQEHKNLSNDAITKRN